MKNLKCSECNCSIGKSIINNMIVTVPYNTCLQCITRFCTNCGKNSNCVYSYIETCNCCEDGRICNNVSMQYKTKYFSCRSEMKFCKNKMHIYEIN